MDIGARCATTKFGFLSVVLAVLKAGGYVRGVVKTFDSERGIGIIRGENGDKYPVTLAEVIKLQRLATGQPVHFSVRFVNNHAFATDVGIRQADPKGIFILINEIVRQCRRRVTPRIPSDVVLRVRRRLCGSDEGRREKSDGRPDERASD